MDRLIIARIAMNCATLLNEKSLLVMTEIFSQTRVY